MTLPIASELSPLVISVQGSLGCQHPCTSPLSRLRCWDAAQDSLVFYAHTQLPTRECSGKQALCLVQSCVTLIISSCWMENRSPGRARPFKTHLITVNLTPSTTSLTTGLYRTAHAARIHALSALSSLGSVRHQLRASIIPNKAKNSPQK